MDKYQSFEKNLMKVKVLMKGKLYHPVKRLVQAFLRSDLRRTCYFHLKSEENGIKVEKKRTLFLENTKWAKGNSLTFK